MRFASLAVIFSFIFSAVWAQGSDADRVEERTIYGQTLGLSIKDVPFEMSAELREFLDANPESKAAFQHLLDHLRPHLKQVLGADVDLPESSFDTNGRIIDLSDLIIRFDSSELEELSGRAFTADQMLEIANSATFHIESLSKPGEYHVWKIHWVWQTGETQIKANIRQSQAGIYKQIVIEIPERLYNSKRFNTVAGAKKFFVDGLLGLVTNLIGARQMVKTYDEYEIESLVDSARAVAVRSRLLKELGADFDPWYLPADDDMEAYRRLENIKEILERIGEKTEEEWQESRDRVAESIRAELQEEVSKGNIDPEDVPQAFVNRMSEARNRLFVSHILASEALVEIGEDMPTRVANRARALVMIGSAELKLDAENRADREAIEQELKEKHKVRSLIPAWLEKQVEKKWKPRATERAASSYQETLVQLIGSGLQESAIALKASIDFDVAEAPALREKLESAQEAARQPVFGYRRLSPKRAVKYDETTNEYCFDPYAVVRIKSTAPGWRIPVFFLRAGQIMWNGDYKLLTGFWRGRFGWKSLVVKDRFPVEWGLADHKTGELEPVEWRSSYRGGLKAVWASVREARYRYEQKPKSGLFGPIQDVMFGVYNTGFRGVGGSFALSALHIGGAVVWPVASTVGLITSPIWAGFSSGFASLWNYVVRDMEPGPDRRRGWRAWFGAGDGERWSPLLYQSFLKGIVGGGVEFLTTLGTALFVHPAVAIYHGGRAVLSGVGRRGLDWGMRGVLRKWGQTPRAKDSWSVRRVSGPGIASEYFYQMDYKLALLALQAQMEKDHLDRIVAAVDSAIREENYSADTVLSKLSAGFRGILPSASLDPQGSVVESNKEPGQETLESFREKAVAQIRSFGALLDIPERRSIRFAEENLQKLLFYAEPQAKESMTALMKTWSAEEVEAFWAAHDVDANDWPTLTVKLLRKVFHEDIDEVIEDIDSLTSVETKDEVLGDLIEDLERGLPPFQPEKARPIVRRRAEPGSGVVSQVVEMYGEDVCRSSLRNMRAVAQY